MTYLLSTSSTAILSSSRFLPRPATAGRFVLHFVEMVIAMQLGMFIYMPVASLMPVSVQPIGMALFMAAPMVAWMRIRGHGWRHGFEMGLAMLVPGAAVVGLVAIGAAKAPPWLAQADGPAMYLGMLAAKHPSTTWVPNVRWFDDRAMVESTTLSSDIDATLHVVDRFAGRSTALDVARQIGYTNTAYLDDPRWAWPTEQWPTAAPLDDRVGAMLVTGAFRGDEHLGVPLFDGVSEAGLAGLLDPSGASPNIRTYVMAQERTVVRSRNGFQFVPRFDFGTVPALDRVLVPVGDDGEAKRQLIAAWSSNQTRRPVEDIFRNVGNGETAYEATFEDLARTQGSNFARAAASVLFYVIDPSRLQGADWSVQDVLTLGVLSLLGAAAVYGATHVKISPRAYARRIPQPA